MKPPMPRTITPLSPSYHAPITRGRRRKPIAFHAYMVRVNDDGYPVEEPEPTDRPRVIRPASFTPGRAPTDPGREARIRWHSIRIDRNE